MTRTLRVLLVCCAVATAWPASSQAQIKSLLKKKAAAQITGEDKASDGKSPKAGPQFGGDLVELAGPVLEDFVAAHALENQLIRDFRQQLTRYKPGEEVEACQKQLAMTPEAQKIMLQIANLGENATAADVLRANEKIGREMEALTKSKCGESIDAVWPQYKRAQRMADFRDQAALAFDSALDARVAVRPSGPFAGEYTWESQKKPTRKYPTADERVTAFCAAYFGKTLQRQTGAFWYVQGSSPGNFFIYTDDEYDALIKKCKQIEHEEEHG